MFQSNFKILIKPSEHFRKHIKDFYLEINLTRRL